MRIRLILPLIPLAAVALAAAPAAAAAQERAPSRHLDADRAAALLSNPAVQDGVVAMIAQFSDALLQTQVGPLAALTDPRDDVRSNDTLRDVLRRDDPYFDERLHDNSRRAVATAGTAARGVADMTRELQATAERLRRLSTAFNGY